MAEKMLTDKLPSNDKDDIKDTSKSLKSTKKKPDQLSSPKRSKKTLVETRKVGIGQSSQLTGEKTCRSMTSCSTSSDADGIDANFSNTNRQPTSQVGLPSASNELSVLCQQMTSTITEQIRKGLNDIKSSAASTSRHYDYEHPFMYNDCDYEHEDYEDDYDYDNNYYYDDQEDKIEKLCSSNVQNVDCERKRSKSTNLDEPEVDTGDENNVVNVDTTKEDVLQHIAAELSAGEQTSDKINTELADLVNSLVLRPGRDSEPDEKFKDRLKTTLRPENCASLVNTKVDELIWSRLQTKTKTFDLKLQYPQSLLIKGLIKTVKIMDVVLMEKDNIPKSEIIIKEGIYDSMLQEFLRKSIMNLI
ncbi:hypothetical protein SNE40_013159 [Patella caerulea]|uniref:Uncharacterized protein n=1 Tax=Patella caerulea TaxID=87958 RepID=A0AAN8PNH5_PATCE